MQSAVGKRLQSLSVYTVSSVPMLSTNQQHCWKL